MHPIIQTYLENGWIDKEAAVRLERFEDMTKEAGFFDTIRSVLPKIWSTVKDTTIATAKTSIGPAVGAATGIGLSNWINKREFQKKQEEQQAQINRSFAQMQEMIPKLKKSDEGLVRQRFDEVAKISPTAAQTPTVAANIVHRTLKKGLGEDDVRKLYQLESHAKNVQHVSMPDTSGAQMVRAVAPRFGQNIAEAVMEVAGVAPPGGHYDLTDKAVKAEPMTSLVGEGEEVLRQAKSLAEIQSYYGNASNIVKRIRAARAAGVPLHPEIMNLNFKNAQDIETFRSKYMDPRGSQHQVGQKLFPELQKWEQTGTDLPEHEKQASVLADVHILVKTAGVMDWVPKGTARALLTAAALGIGSAGAHWVADEIASKKRIKALKESWDLTQGKLKKMTRDGDRLAFGIDYNSPSTQQEAQNTFNTLVAVAPDLAVNPTIATAYVNKVMNAGEVDVGAIKTISEIQKNMDQVSGYKNPMLNSPVAKGFQAGFQAAGGKEVITSMARETAKTDKEREWEQMKYDSEMKGFKENLSGKKDAQKQEIKELKEKLRLAYNQKKGN